MLLAALALLLAPLTAHALDWTLRVEPGIAFPLSAPQTTHFGVGGGGAIKGGISPLRFLDVHLGANLLWFSAKDKGAVGTDYALGGGLRFIWRSDLIVAPWLDSDLLYVRTGAANRFSFAFGAGVAFPVEKTRFVWLGPYLRYQQIVTGDQVGTDSADAKILAVGISLELRTPRAAKTDSDRDGVLDGSDRCPREPEDLDGFQDTDGCPDADNDGDGVADADDKCPNQAGTMATGGCPATDSDHDGVIDSEDRCPLSAGEGANNGCPTYRQVKVTQANIELAEKIFFAFDRTDILPKSFGLLDEVVQALRDHSTIRVRIEGHTDDRGTAAYNQQLSEGRAEAVRNYLVERGIAPERLEARGYGSSLPLDTNKTSEGREKNRRVEFVIIK